MVPKKSAGTDSISVESMKSAIPDIAVPLCKIINDNNSFLLGIVYLIKVVKVCAV
jgi:hypothetical protein